ncbi:hypothetical protein Mgra_00009472, partial [Meloidogyne graminicola]
MLIILKLNICITAKLKQFSLQTVQQEKAQKYLSLISVLFLQKPKKCKDE